MAGSVDLAFEGGGVKGIGLAGAFAVLDEQGYTPHCVAGTSAGAITAALVAAGYSGSELEDVALHEMKFSQFADPHPIDHLGLAGQGIAILKERGINKGDFFLGWMRDRLAKKNVRTFRDLVNASVEDRDPARYRLQVIASDVTERRMLVLPRDAQAHLGIAPEELEVALAVRMSMSIPIFFDPVRWTNPETKQEHLIVDGGLLSNFPIWLSTAPPARHPRGLRSACSRSLPTRPTLCSPPNPRRRPTHRTSRRRPRSSKRSWNGDAGPRPALRRAGQLRPHDPDPHARSQNHRVQHPRRPGRSALQIRPRRRHPIPGRLGFQWQLAEFPLVAFDGQPP